MTSGTSRRNNRELAAAADAAFSLDSIEAAEHMGGDSREVPLDIVPQERSLIERIKIATLAGSLAVAVGVSGWFVGEAFYQSVINTH